MLNIDEPPPAYEVNPSSDNNLNNTANENIDAEAAAAAVIIEAPPPYCLVDPSKVRNTDHLPQYSQITPVEIIDLNTNNIHSNDHVRLRLVFFLIIGLFSSLCLVFSSS
jgi:hypothetical protein